MSRDIIAMLAMLAVVAAICLIVTALIYLFAPPGWHRAPPLRTTQSRGLAIHCPTFVSAAPSASHARSAPRRSVGPVSCRRHRDQKGVGRPGEGLFRDRLI